MLEIIEAKTPDHLEAVKSLCREYRTFLIEFGGRFADEVKVAYPEDKYEELLDGLQTEHAAPDGCLRLILVDGEPVGCGMMQRFSADTAEIKRVFLRDAARGTGAGYAIMKTLISDCKEKGYERIYMYTGHVLKAAQKLYDAMGFNRCEPFLDLHRSSGETVVYFEMDIRT